MKGGYDGSDGGRSEERIQTESSYELTPARVRKLLAQAGFQTEASWYEARRWFGLHLARRAAS